ncbi:hypothetical protein VCCP104417_0834, partial [Vibrio cholerae CP1044(17)]
MLRRKTQQGQRVNH